MPIGGAIAAVGSVAGGALAANASAKGAKKGAQAITDASDAATALQRETYYDQRNLLAPSITAGASARARQMLMQGYSPDEVKRFLASTSAAVNAPAAGETGAQGQRGSNTVLGVNDGGFFNGEGQDYTGTGAPGVAQPGEDFSWVDDYDWAPQSPSYQWRFDEGTRATERSKAASGDFFSGDAMIALQERGQNAASQEFEADWRRLGELAGDGTQATGTTVQVAGNFGDSAAANTRAAGQARATGYQQSGNAWGNFWQGAAGIPMYAAGQGWWK